MKPNAAPRPCQGSGTGGQSVSNHRLSDYPRVETPPAAYSSLPPRTPIIGDLIPITRAPVVIIDRGRFSKVAPLNELIRKSSSRNSHGSWKKEKKKTLNAESRCQRVIKGGCCEHYACVIFPFILPAGKQMFELKKKKGIYLS